MKKRYLIGAGVLLAVIAVYFTWTTSIDPLKYIFTTAKKGEFYITVTTTGELEAKNSIDIQGPTGLRSARIWDVKINKLVPEGTVVKKGDFIAELDRSQLTDRLKELQNELEKVESQFTQTQLDTTLDLRQTRDNLINLEYAVEERKIVLEQSAFEPPATIKQAEIELQKAERDFLQAKENYSVKVDQAIAKMREVQANLSKVQNELAFLDALNQEFIIIAPEDGMVIYERFRNGSKKREGSTVSAWNPTVATLPDLSKMVSKTYINEVDIRKIKPGQSVEIGLDAFPEKKLTGKITEVANVGEQKPNSDAKVFEVSIQINETDTTLRPAMTTSNVILADMIPDVVYVPLECLHSQGDTITYVYLKDGLDILRQEVLPGAANDNEIIVLQGLAEGDEIALNRVFDVDDKPIVRIADSQQKPIVSN